MMSDAVYPFTIGSIECAVVSDGTAALAPDAARILFSNAPEDELRRSLDAHEISGLDIPYRVNCLYVRTGDHQVLVDVGFGRGVHPDMGKLLGNLAVFGVKPEAIDTLIITHGHGDHIGGLAGDTGQVIFTEARCVMRRAEWDYWTSEEELAKMHHGADMARAKLPPIKKQLDLVDGEDEIAPGIRVIHADGHTPAHIALSVTSEGEGLLALIDTVLDPIHIEHREWIASVDVLPEQTVATRHTLLGRAADSQALVLCYHFAFPGLGHVVRQGEGFRWRPLGV